MTLILKYSKLVNRPLRMDDDIRELGENTIDKLKEAIEKGDKKLALDLADYVIGERKGQHDSVNDWLYAFTDFIARIGGEEKIPEAMRYAKHILDMNTYHAVRKTCSVFERLILRTEGIRAHLSGPKERGDFKVWEEPDRYVMEMDPCGGGLRMVRGYVNGTGSRIKPPYNLGVTTKPYPWSWGKTGVPYYCIHCCVWTEIMPIEEIGYPYKVTEYPADDPSKPCYWYFYKDPNLVPAEYFERVGFKKDPSRFR